MLGYSLPGLIVLLPHHCDIAQGSGVLVEAGCNGWHCPAHLMGSCGMGPLPGWEVLPCMALHDLWSSWPSLLLQNLKATGLACFSLSPVGFGVCSVYINGNFPKCQEAFSSLPCVQQSKLFLWGRLCHWILFLSIMLLFSGVFLTFLSLGITSPVGFDSVLTV